MASPWNRFEKSLAEKGKTFEAIQGLTGDEDIKSLIRKYGFAEIDEIAEILTEFKKRQGNT